MKFLKYFYTISAGFLMTGLVFAQGTLYQNFMEQWGYFPSLKERTPIYAEISDDIYKGTAEQNKKLNEYIFSPVFGSLAFPPSTVEGTSTAGWTDDGSVVRLNTAADTVGIGTLNPSEKLSVVGGNIFDSGNLTVAGGTFTFGNGTATSTFTASSAARIGLGTTTPGTLFSVQGNSLTSGTTTAGGFYATSTIQTNSNLIVASTTKWGSFTYHPPQTLGGNTDVMRMRNGATNEASLYWDPVSSVNDWIELDTQTNTTGSSTIGTKDFASARHLKVIINTAGIASASTIGIRFNRDAGTNYYSKDFLNYIVQNQSLADNQILLFSQSTTSPATYAIDIPNISGTPKSFSWNGATSNASAIPQISSGMGTWQNTSAQITQITVFSSQNFNANTRLTIYGSKN